MYKNNKRAYKNILKMCAVDAKKRKEKKKIVSSGFSARIQNDQYSVSLLAILKSFQGGGPGYLEIRNDVDIGSRRDRVARGGSPFTKSNIRVIYHLAVANAREGVREAICAP